MNFSNMPIFTSKTIEVYLFILIMALPASFGIFMCYKTISFFNDVHTIAITLKQLPGGGK